MSEQRCPFCDSRHAREGLTARLWDGETWEGYRKCAASDIPSDTRWDLSRHSDKRHAIYFGGSPDGSSPHEWGAPFRRVITLATKRVELARYHRTRKTPKEKLRDD